MITTELPFWTRIVVPPSYFRAEQGSKAEIGTATHSSTPPILTKKFKYENKGILKK
jgi:hypothetical protein